MDTSLPAEDLRQSWEGLWADLANAGATKITSGILLRGLGRGAINAGAQTVGNLIAHPSDGLITSLGKVNLISSGLSALNVGFGTNAMLSGNFNLNVVNGFRSTLTGTIDINQSIKSTTGGLILGATEESIKDATPSGLNYGWQFVFTATETGLDF